jgi:hypothetical protein
MGRLYAPNRFWMSERFCHPVSWPWKYLKGGISALVKGTLSYRSLHVSVLVCLLGVYLLLL